MTIELRFENMDFQHIRSKELGRSINTILIEIRRGTTIQIRQGNHVQVYITDTSEAVRNFKLLECSNFSKVYCRQNLQNDSWSPDASIGEGGLPMSVIIV